MLAWKIAWRYLLSKKSHGAVNIISLVSVCGVAVATAAIVIVLSVFNGFTWLASSHLAVIDPDLKLVPCSGKAFANGDSLAQTIATLPGVSEARCVVEERGLMVSGNSQMPVIFRGADANADHMMIDGVWPADSSQLPGGLYQYPTMAISIGVALKTGLRPSTLPTATLYAPRRVGRLNPANPATSFREAEMIISGVFEVEQPEYDNEYVLVPLSVARDLLQYDSEATAIEVSLQPGARNPLQDTPEYRVLDRFQQQAEAFKMIKVEKWVTFMMLAFILIIASFNIVSTLSLLVIEKRDNMRTLRCLGATSSMVRGVFSRIGLLITLIGGVAGIILGTLLSLAQQWGGFIKLSGDPSQLTIDVYPVVVSLSDIGLVFGLVVLVASIIALMRR